jgi:hypothetical protein
MIRPAKGIPQMSDMGLEEPVPDSVEQDQDAIRVADEPAGTQPADRPFEADEADVAEQGQEFELGEDDYR